MYRYTRVGHLESVYSDEICFIRIIWINQTIELDSHHSNETNFDLYVPGSRTLTNLLIMQTSLGTKQLKMGLCMLNMQFDADGR